MPTLRSRISTFFLIFLATAVAPPSLSGQDTLKIPMVRALAAGPGDTSSSRLLDALTPTLLRDLRSGALNDTPNEKSNLPWRVVAHDVDSVAAETFRRKVLAEMGSRAAAYGDTLVVKLEVRQPIIKGDSAVLEVDHGRFWCERGELASVGKVTDYYFRRTDNEWKFVKREPELWYDPPPIPRAPAKNDSCLEALNRLLNQ